MVFNVVSLDDTLGILINKATQQAKHGLFTEMIEH